MKKKNYFGFRWVTISYLPALFCFGIICLCCFHNYYFLFVEQFQIFRTDSLYIENFLKEPGGISAYTGCFITQFYLFNHIGGAIICILLTLLFLLMYLFMRKSGYSQFYLPLLAIPCILIFYCFFDINTRAGTLTALLIIFMLLHITRSLTNPILRRSCFLILIPVLYWTTGAGVFTYAILMGLYELKKPVRPVVIGFIISVLLFAITMPFVAQHYIPLTGYKAWMGISYYNSSQMPLWNYLSVFSIAVIFVLIYLLQNSITSEKMQRVLFFLTIASGVFLVCWSYIKKVNHKQQELYCWDYHLKHRNWEQILSLSGRYNHYDPLYINITNLALANTGQLSTHLFHFPQIPDAVGLWTSNFYPMSVTGEIYTQLDMPQIARSFFFMANTQSPHSQSSYLYKRLAETELLTDNIPIAEKYISSLANTLFHKKQITEMQEMICNRTLSDEMKIRKANQPSHPGFFATGFKYNLQVQYKEHPDNSFVRDYLMAQCILENDFQAFFNILDQNTNAYNKINLPILYQEFIMMYAYMIKDNSLVNRYHIHSSVVQSFYNYLQINQEENSAEKKKEELKKTFGNTYWYYAQYINRIKL